MKDEEYEGNIHYQVNCQIYWSSNIFVLFKELN